MMVVYVVVSIIKDRIFPIDPERICSKFHPNNGVISVAEFYRFCGKTALHIFIFFFSLIILVQLLSFDCENESCLFKGIFIIVKAFLMSLVVSYLFQTTIDILICITLKRCLFKKPQTRPDSENGQGQIKEQGQEQTQQQKQETQQQE